MISIIIPLLSQKPSMLKDCISSVLQQSSKNWELIFGCSGDEAEEAVKAHSIDPRIRYIRGSTMDERLNSALNAANSEFVAEMHSDDMISVHAISTLALYIEQYPWADFLHSSKITVDDAGRPLYVRWVSEAKTREDFINGAAGHMMCWRKSKAISIGGFDKGIYGVDDYDFPFSMFDAGAKFKAILEPIYIHRDHRSHERVTTDLPMDEQLDTLRRWLKKHGLTESEVKREVEERGNSYMRQTKFATAGVERGSEKEWYYGMPVSKYSRITCP